MEISNRKMIQKLQQLLDRMPNKNVRTKIKNRILQLKLKRK
jgi:hypothetical protein